MPKVCRCLCHTNELGDRFEIVNDSEYSLQQPRPDFGKKVLCMDPLEAAIACDKCKLEHIIALRNWRMQNDPPGYPYSAYDEYTDETLTQKRKMKGNGPSAPEQ